MSKTTKVKDRRRLYAGSNLAWAQSQMRHVPKSRNKTKYHRPSAKKETQNA